MNTGLYIHKVVSASGVGPTLFFSLTNGDHPSWMHPWILRYIEDGEIVLILGRDFLGACYTVMCGETLGRISIVIAHQRLSAIT